MRVQRLTLPVPHCRSPPGRRGSCSSPAGQAVLCVPLLPGDRRVAAGEVTGSGTKPMGLSAVQQHVPSQARGLPRDVALCG